MHFTISSSAWKRSDSSTWRVPLPLISRFSFFLFQVLFTTHIPYSLFLSGEYFIAICARNFIYPWFDICSISSSVDPRTVLCFKFTTVCCCCWTQRPNCVSRVLFLTRGRFHPKTILLFDRWSAVSLVSSCCRKVLIYLLIKMLMSDRCIHLVWRQKRRCSVSSTTPSEDLKRVNSPWIIWLKKCLALMVVVWWRWFIWFPVDIQECCFGFLLNNRSPNGSRSFFHLQSEFVFQKC